MFAMKKTEPLSGLSEEEYQSITRKISEKEFNGAVQAAKRGCKKYKTVSPKEAIKILQKKDK